jgi:hypothetical protein
MHRLRRKPRTSIWASTSAADGRHELKRQRFPFYAAGDIVRGLNHVIVAAAQSAIAATVIRSKLRGC